MEKLIKNIVIASSSSINKNKYFYSLLKLKNAAYEKSYYDYNPLLIYKLVYNETIFIFNINIISITYISSKIEYDGLIEIYDTFDSFEFIENFEESFHKEFGDKNFPTIRINLSEEMKNESIYPILYIGNETINEIKWKEIFIKLIEEFKKDEMDEFPYNLLNSNNSHNIDNFNGNNSYIQNTNENKKGNLKPWLIFISLIFFSLLDIYVISFISEYNNIKYIYDGVFINIKLLVVIFYFYISYIGICIIRKNKKKNAKTIKYKNYLKLSFVIGILILLFEIYNFIKNSCIVNKKRNYNILQIIFDFILIILFLILIYMKYMH